MALEKRERKKKTKIDDKNIVFETKDNSQETKAIISSSVDETDHNVDELAKEWTNDLKKIVDQKNQSEDRRRKVPALEWEFAAANYATGMYELDDIAEKLGVARITVSKKFAEMGIKKGDLKKELTQQVKEKVVESHFMDVDESNALYAEALRTQYRYAKAIMDASMKAVLTAVKDNGSAAAAKDEVITFDKQMSMIAKWGDVNRVALDRARIEEATSASSIQQLPIYFMSPEDEAAIANHTNSDDFGMGMLDNLSNDDFDSDIIEESNGE